MSRRGNAKPTGIQMFPFLAVLICTMGALVVLLHAFAQNGKAQATKAAEAKRLAQSSEQELDADFYRWRAEHLREARRKTEEELAAERLKLSHIEDHQRRLEEKLQQLKIAAKELEKAGSVKADEKDQNAKLLAETQEELERARRAIDEAKQKGKFKVVNYSIVPFDGLNSTHRRPIYIECRENRITLQPEGIELTPRDFIGFFGPGNPLASALRAQREYFAGQAPPGVTPDEPYPLLVVRPDGIAAYYAARAALESWGSEFGYELLDADCNLEFPPGDPQLEQLTARVVEEARQRHREYILSSPEVAKRRSRPVYHAKPHGGFALEPGTGDGPRGNGMGDWDDYSPSSAKPSGSGRGRGGPGGTNEYGGFGTDPDAKETPGGLAEYGSAMGGPADPYAEPGEFAPRQRGQGDGSIRGDEFSQMQQGGGGSGQPGAAERGDLTQRGAYGSPGANTPYDPSSPPGGRGGEKGPVDADGQTASQDGSSSQKQGQPGGQGQSMPQGQELSMQQSAQQDGSGSAPGGAQTQVESPLSQANGGTPSHSGAPSSATGGSSKKPPQNLASVRGQDWGVNGSSVGAIGASRPILVQCHNDRLIIVPESRNQKAQEIRLGPEAQDSVDEFVSAVWDYSKVWGKAGKGLYWRPTLVMDVRPGGEERFYELQVLLAGSGLDLQRYGAPRNTQQSQPTPPRR